MEAELAKEILPVNIENEAGSDLISIMQWAWCRAGGTPDVCAMG